MANKKTETRICKVCGDDFQGNLGRGRKREHCGLVCKDYSVRRSQLFGIVTRMKFKTPAHRAAMTSDLFSLANACKHGKDDPEDDENDEERAA